MMLAWIGRGASKARTYRAVAKRLTLLCPLFAPYTRPLSIFNCRTRGAGWPLPLPLRTLLRSSVSLLFTLLISPVALCVRQRPDSVDPLAPSDDKNDDLRFFGCAEFSLVHLDRGAPKSWFSAELPLRSLERLRERAPAGVLAPDDIPSSESRPLQRVLSDVFDRGRKGLRNFDQPRSFSRGSSSRRDAGDSGQLAHSPSDESVVVGDVGIQMSHS